MKVMVVFAAVVLGGCTAQPASDADRRTPAPTSATPTSAPPSTTITHRPVTLGFYVGARLNEVRRWLRESGLQVDVQERTTCLDRIVLAQDPRPGTKVRAGESLTLTVSRLNPAAWCVPASTKRWPQALHAWARGEAPAPAFADKVRVMQGDQVVLTLSAEEALDPERWTMPGGYAESIPLKSINWLADQPRLVPRDVPPFGCPGRTTALPSDLADRLGSSRSLVTTGGTACMQVGAVQVWVDREERIEAVNLVLGSP